jgi:hypothetical protein
MEQTYIFSDRIRWLVIATGVASALAFLPIFAFLYPALLIVGGLIQPRYPNAGKWFVWAAAASLGVVVAHYDAMILPHPWHQPKYSLYMVLTFSATTVLLVWCSAELVVDGLRNMWARHSMPPAEARPVSQGVWILAVVLNLLVVWEVTGWMLAPNPHRPPVNFYTLGMPLVHTVIVMAFDISLMRRVVELRRTRSANRV